MVNSSRAAGELSLGDRDEDDNEDEDGECTYGAVNMPGAW